MSRLRFPWHMEVAASCIDAKAAGVRPQVIFVAGIGARRQKGQANPGSDWLMSTTHHEV